MAPTPRLIRIAVALSLLLSALPAQTSPPASCFGLNVPPPTSTAMSYLPVVAGGELFLGFTAPSTVSVEQVELALGNLPNGAVLAFDVFNAVGGVLTSYIAGTSAIAGLPGAVANFPIPIPFAAGGTYALRVAIVSGATSVLVQGLAAPTTPLTYVLLCGSTPPFLLPTCPSYPTTGTFGATLRFRAAGCGSGPAASVTTIGTGCPTLGAGIGGPALTVGGPPVIGANLTFWMNGFAGGTYYLYWTPGPATAGIPTPTGCLFYLDPAGFVSLAAAGLEPFAIIPVLGLTNAFNFTIPANPALAGVRVCFQALLLNPAGAPIAPGLTGYLTNALELSLGY